MRWSTPFFLFILVLLINEIKTKKSQEGEKEATKKNVIEYQSPYADPNRYYFAEHFDDEESFNKKWIQSEAKKDDASYEIAKYDGLWQIESPHRIILENDYGLVLKSKAKHSAISSRLIKPFVFSDKILVVQYEVALQNGQDCGGSYIKLLSSGHETTNLIEFNDKTPYTIMFGPDKCGNDAKLHFIFRHKNPINGTISEIHCRKPKERIEEPFKDKQPHLYQLIVRPDNSYTISFDHKIINEGSLLTDFQPPINPPAVIEDPLDVKPDNWDEREKIPDPDAKKPDDWDDDALPHIPDVTAQQPINWLEDEEEMIPDPDAVKPEDWDEEMDGKWEAPLINNPICEKAVGCGKWKPPLIENPAYKGKYRSPLIDNPNYQGKWAPRKIANPDFYEDLHPFKMKTIAAVGIELWSMSDEILFDNIVITDDVDLADNWAAQTFDIKRKQIDFEAETLVSRLIKFPNENPWMYAVYIIVIGLPLSLIIFYLCSSKKDDNIESTEPKKTDEYQPDDIYDNEESTTESKHSGDGDQNREQNTVLPPASPKKKAAAGSKGKKSDLDQPLEKQKQQQSETENAGVENDDGIEDVQDAEEYEDEGISDDVEEKKASVDDKSESLEPSAESTGHSSTGPTNEGTRKRKPRKD